MRRKMGKLLTALTLSLLVLSAMAIPASADEPKAEAYIAFSDAAWGSQYWLDGKDWAPVVNTNATVTGAGQYTVGLDFTKTELGYAEGCAFTAVMIKDGETIFPGNTMAINSVKINGAEVSLGKTYTSSDDGKETRVNLYNEWVSEIKDARNANGDVTDVTSTPVNRDDLVQVKTIEVTFTVAEGDGSAAPGGEEAATDYVLPTEFKAFMMFSSPNGNWSCYEALESGANTTTVLGDGTYTVTMKGEDIAAKGAADQAQVFVVDIIDMGTAMAHLGTKYQSHLEGVAQENDITISAEVYVDGNKVNCKSKKIIFGDTEENGRFRMEFYNVWGAHSALVVNDPPVMPENICPESEIKVVFKLKGTGLNTEAAAAEEAAAEAAAQAEKDAAAAAEAAAQAEKDAAAAAEAEKEAEATPAVQDTSTDNAVSNSPNTGLIIGIVIAVLAVAGVVTVVIVSKKKKQQ